MDKKECDCDWSLLLVDVDVAVAVVGPPLQDTGNPLTKVTCESNMVAERPRPTTMGVTITASNLMVVAESLAANE